MVDESEKTYDVILTPQFLSDLGLCVDYIALAYPKAGKLRDLTILNHIFSFL